jgi:tetratricopeptide (TPR) repeat protein
VFALAVLAGCALLRAGTAAAQGQAGEAVPSSSVPAPEVWIGRAVAAMAARDFGAAVRAADSAEALAPDRSAVQLVVGQAYLSHARDNPSLGAIGKVKKGRAALERAIALDPDNLDARTTLLQFLLQAPDFVGGSKDGAREQAREIERRDPQRGLLARLDVAIAGGKKDELRTVYADALPLLGGPADNDGALARAFLAAAGRIKDKKLRKELTARVAGAAGRERLRLRATG